MADENPPNQSPSPTAPPPRRGGRWRWFLRALVFLVLTTVVLFESLWLARWQLFDWFARAPVEALLGEALQGHAELGQIDGNIFTGLRIRGIEIDGTGPVRSVHNAAIRVQLAPLKLLRSDLGGIVSLQVRIAALELDLTMLGGGAAAEDPEEAAGPIDLAAFAALLPAGAEIVVDDLKVHGLAAERNGRARISLAAASPRSPVRRLHALLPGIDATVALSRDAEVQCELAARDVATLPQLFARLDHLSGGEGSASVSLQLAPVFAAAADVRIDGMTANGHRISRCDFAAQVHSDGLQSLACDLEGNGLTLRASGGSMQFAAPLATLRGDVALAIRDIGPWSEFLPPQVRDLLPITGSLAATARDGHVTIADGFLRSPIAVLRLRAGSLRFDGEPSLDAPVRAELELVQPASMPLLATLPLQPTSGRIELELGQRDRAFTAALDLLLDGVDRNGRSGTLQGRADVARAEDGAIAFASELDLRGEILRGGAERLSLLARGEATATQLRLDEATIGIDGGAQATARARVPLAATDTAALLADLEVDATWTALPLLLIDAFAIPQGEGRIALRGDTDGSLVGSQGTFALQLRAAATSAPFLLPSELAEVAVEAKIDATGFSLEALALQTPFVRVRGNGEVPGLTLPNVLAGTLDWSTLSPTFDLDVACDESQRPRLEAFAGVAFATSLRLRDRSLRIESLQAWARGHELAATGVVRALAEGYAVDDLVIRDGNGSAVTLTGTLGDLDDGDWRTSLRRADLRAEFRRFALEPFLPALGIPAATARLDGSLSWQPATSTALALDLHVESTGIVSGTRTVDAEFTVIAEGSDDGTHLRQFSLASNGAVVRGSGTLAVTPMQLLDDPKKALDAAVRFELSMPSTDVAALPEQLLRFAQWQGRIAIDIELGGTLQKPEPRALVQVQNGSLLTADGQRLDEIQARIVVTPDAAQIETLTASRGRGPLSVQGGLTAPGPLWDRWRDAQVELAVTGTDVLLHRRAGVKVRTDLDVHVRGPLGELTIDGDVMLKDSLVLQRIPLLDFQRTSGRATTEGIAIPGLDLGPFVSARLDLRITTKEPFKIRNNLLDGSLDVALAVRGTLANPVLEGTVSGPEARIVLPGIRLRASTLLVEFRRDAPRFPVLTVNANGRRHGFDVNVVVRGRYDRPEILLSSSPPLPPEELIVLITTGARPDSLRGSAGVGTVLGAYLAQELADWIFGSESTEAKESFVDRFSIETGTELSRGGTQSIVVEFRVFDDIYLKGERDVYEDLNMGVVYRLRFR
ncbi:MAG: translocation/assembly module TamB domain-containing protein [Planctomycetota bacterium]